jgi:hypothetical protein
MYVSSPPTNDELHLVTMSYLFILLVLPLPILYYLLKPPSIPGITNASHYLPVLGNALAFRKNPVQFMLDQRAIHGDVFLVNLGFVRFVYFLGPEGTNAIFRGTERSGLSQFDTLTLLLGVGAKKCSSEASSLLTGLGLNVEGYLDIIPAIHKSLSTPARLEYWREQMWPIAKKQFDKWAESGKPVSLFRGISELVVRVLLHLFVGSDFASKHEDELVPLVLEYEAGIQKPEVRVLPRWPTKSGRFLISTEKRFEKLIAHETKMRLANSEKYKDEMDFLQVLINTTDGKHTEGNYPYLHKVDERIHITSS